MAEKPAFIDPFETTTADKQKPAFVDPFETQDISAPKKPTGFGAQKRYRETLKQAFQEIPPEMSTQRGYVSPETARAFQEEFKRVREEGPTTETYLGMAKGLPLGPYAGLAGLANLVRIPVPTGQQAATYIYGPPASKAEESGRESGMFFTGAAPIGKVGVAAAKPIITGLEKGAEKIPEVARAIRPSVAAEKTLGEVTSKTDLGTLIEKTLVDRLRDLVAGKQQEAKTMFENFYQRAEPYVENVRNSLISDLRTYAIQNQGKLTAKQQKLITGAEEALTSPATVRGAEGVLPKTKVFDAERRLLKDKASGKMEGIDALEMQTAKDLENIFRQGLKKYIPNSQFASILQNYQNLMKPINLFETAFGQAATKRAGQYLLEIPKQDVANLADKAFKSESSVNALRQLAGNNEAFVVELAKKYVANSLGKSPNSKAVYDFINKPENYDWLKTMPKLYRDLQELGSNLKNAERIKKGVGLGALGLGGLVVGKKAVGGIKSVIGD